MCPSACHEDTKRNGGITPLIPKVGTTWGQSLRLSGEQTPVPTGWDVRWGPEQVHALRKK